MSQVEVTSHGNIQEATTWLNINGELVNHHYYTRFIGEETELWVFGCGLGDQAVSEQVGAAFLEYCKHGDPELGRIMLCIGDTATSIMPYKGDFNVWWAWSDRPNWIEEYYRRVTVEPELVLCVSHYIEEEATIVGIETLYLPLATGRDFKPLGLERKGFGYAGNPVRSTEQYHILLEPFINTDFEWVTRKATDPYLTLAQLNEFYNRKQIVFGMIGKQSKDLHLVSNRLFETLASGTPFITGRYDLEDMFSFEYPYMTETQDETIELVADILTDYPRHLKRFAEYSEEIRRNHTFDVRVKTLMEYLEK